MHHTSDSYLALLKKIRVATVEAGLLPDDTKCQILHYFAKRIAKEKEAILKANHKDILYARRAGRDEAFLDRLTITGKKIQDMVKEVHLIASLPDPVGQVREEYTVSAGVHLKKITVPLGVIFIIYESRPDVTVNASALCIKSGNAVILKGGSESLQTNKMLVRLAAEALKAQGLRSGATWLRTVSLACSPPIIR